MSGKLDFELRSRVIGGLSILNHFLERLQITNLFRKHLPAGGPRAQLMLVEASGVLLRNLIVSRMAIYSQEKWA